jgi:hypothetical protein
VQKLLSVLVAIAASPLQPPTNSGVKPVVSVVEITSRISNVRLFSKQGTPIELTGKSPVQGAPLAFFLKEKERLVAQSVADEETGEWKIEWSADSLPLGVHSAWLYYARAGASEPTAFARLSVQVVAEYPFSTALSVPEDPATMPLKCVVKPVGGIVASKITFKIDGVAVEAKGGAEMALPVNRMPAGAHVLAVAVQVENQEIELDALPFTLPSKIQMKPLPSKKMTAEDVFTLGVEPSVTLSIASVEYVLDGELLHKSAKAPFNDAKIVAGNLESGLHTLFAIARETGGAERYSPLVRFSVANPRKAQKTAAPSQVASMSSQFDEWEIQYRDMANSIKSSIERVALVSKQQFIGAASVSEAKRQLQQEVNILSSYRYLGGQAPTPSKLSGENARTLRVAVKQLSVASLNALNVARTLNIDVGRLKRYDNTLSNMDRVARGLWIDKMNQHRRNLDEALKLAKQGVANVELVNARGG